MHNTFPDDHFPLITICKCFNHLYVEEHKWAEYFNQDANKSSIKLLTVDPSNYIALLTKAIFCIKETKIIEARDILVEGIVYSSNFL